MGLGWWARVGEGSSPPPPPGQPLFVELSGAASSPGQRQPGAPRCSAPSARPRPCLLGPVQLGTPRTPPREPMARQGAHAQIQRRVLSSSLPPAGRRQSQAGKMVWCRRRARVMLIPCSVSGSQADKAPRPLRLLLSGDPMGAPSIKAARRSLQRPPALPGARRGAPAPLCGAGPPPTLGAAVPELGPGRPRTGLVPRAPRAGAEPHPGTSGSPLPPPT